MSKLIFTEMVKGSEEDRAQVVEFFREDAQEWLDAGYRFILGVMNETSIIMATCDSRFSEIDIEVATLVNIISGREVDVPTDLYEEMLAELERLARGIGASSLKTSDDALTDRMEFIQACYSQGFAGDDVSMVKILDQEAHEAELAKVRLDLVNAELSAEAIE